ncbi:MAG: low molecular weight protein-tyrosine-phosphatase [Chromatocurvus sp.]
MRILFVCLGNICRSPTAQAVFSRKLEQRGFAATVDVDSCGTLGSHQGEPPDERASAAAATRGYNLSGLRSRQLRDTDFEQFDYILAMDEDNLHQIRQRAGADYAGKLGLFLSWAPKLGVDEVPDPYFGEDDGFAHVLDLVEAASEALLDHLERELG